jgi:hypothetical protein
MLVSARALMGRRLRAQSGEKLYGMDFTDFGGSFSGTGDCIK